jgi:hypothetical protein
MEGIGPDDEVFGVQDRVNASIRRTFDLLLSMKGLQRPRLVAATRFVGLEHALQFYDTVRVRGLLPETVWPGLARKAGAQGTIVRTGTSASKSARDHSPSRLLTCLAFHCRPHSPSLSADASDNDGRRQSLP